MSSKRDICDRTFKFSVRSYKLCKELSHPKINERIISRQLLKSSTSVGANVEEAQAGQSLADMVSKYNIALKEARETLYWLRLIKEVDIFPNDKLDSVITECNEITAILTTIVKKLRMKMQ